MRYAFKSVSGKPKTTDSAKKLYLKNISIPPLKKREGRVDFNYQAFLEKKASCEMRILNALICCALFIIETNAQWTKTGTNIYPTTITDKVVIGTTTPYSDAQFSVTGATRINNTVSLGGVPANAAGIGKLHVANQNTIISFSPGTSTQWLIMNHANQLTGIRHYNGTTPTSADDKYSIGAATAANNAVFFLNGKIGIGTNTPTNWLDIATGNGDNGITLRGTGAGYAPFLTFKDNGTAAANKYSMRYDGGAKKFYLGYGDVAGFTPQLMVEQSSGNVGIGVLTATEKLEVSGNIKASGMVIASSIRIKDWDILVPDYVFEPDYNLKSLKETESFIKNNKHLEGIPSATKLKTEGMNIAEMNLQLLKKVEELTLYIIDQEKRIAQIESRNN